MNRRNFLATSTASAFAALILPLPFKSALAQDSCLRGLEGIDAESNESPFFTHYHQLIIPVSALVNPPANGIQLVTGKVDQGSFDQEALEAYARSQRIELAALQSHDHIVRIGRAELKQISAGRENVEIKVYARDGHTYVHNFLVTAPRSLLATVEKERK